MQTVKELSTVGLETLKKMAEEASGYIDHIYLHWTAGRYGQIYPEYHVSIDYDGRIYTPYNCLDLTVKREHTWKRNSGSIGIALCGCYDANANNGYNMTMGSNPITQAQIEACAIATAIICKYAGVPIKNVLTHCEAAYIDHYGPYSGDPETRWDLWYLPDSGMGNQYRGGGEVIRGKALWYIGQY